MEKLSDRTKEFAIRIIKLCQVIDSKPGIGKLLCKQLLRSGTSIGANIAESEGAQSDADYLTKCSIAVKEARETQYWLDLLIQSEIINENRPKDIKQESDEIVAILTTICKKMKDKHNAKV